MRLSFHGAAGTVTGSRYLLEAGGRRLLIDCGLFQGYKRLRLRNWSPPPFAPRSIDAVLLTHAHIDHSGYLPRLIREGFDGPVHSSSATRELCSILLPDSGHLHEADAAYARRHGFSKHDPPLPLYTEADGRRALRAFKPVPEGSWLELGPRVRARFEPAGHILGACWVVVEVDGRTICFSGDLGRPDDILMHPPAPRPDTDWLVLESTYGDRLHNGRDPAQVLADIVNRTVQRKGTVVVPAFAVGRTQLLLLLLSRLRDEGKIPDIDTVVDSPMATSVTDLYRRHHDLHRLDDESARRAFDRVRYTRSPEESMELDRSSHSMILISASGMATGGRVVHHLKRFASVDKNTILFTGFQAGGTRGASMLAGAEHIKIHGDWIPIRAEIDSLDMLSAHADAPEIMQWLRTQPTQPREVFITHGEPNASEAMRIRIQEELGWSCTVPEHRDEVEL